MTSRLPRSFDQLQGIVVVPLQCSIHTLFQYLHNCLEYSLLETPKTDTNIRYHKPALPHLQRSILLNSQTTQLMAGHLYKLSKPDPVPFYLPLCSNLQNTRRSWNGPASSTALRGCVFVVFPSFWEDVFVIVYACFMKQHLELCVAQFGLEQPKLALNQDYSVRHYAHFTIFFFITMKFRQEKQSYYYGE